MRGSITIASTQRGYGDFGVYVGINDTNEVAFSASLKAGGSGIFTGADPVKDKVIATGDALLNSTVTAVNSTASALTGAVGNSRARGTAPGGA